MVKAVEGFFQSSKLHLQRGSPTEHLNRLKEWEEAISGSGWGQTLPCYCGVCCHIAIILFVGDIHIHNLTWLMLILAKPWHCLPIDKRGVKQLARGATSPNPNGVIDLGALMSDYPASECHAVEVHGLRAIITAWIYYSLVGSSLPYVSQLRQSLASSTLPKSNSCTEVS